MSIFLWVLGVHLLELLGVGIYFLIRKNSALEKAVVEQQQYINAINIIINQLTNALSEVDQRVWVESDEEFQTVFNKVEEIKSLLKEISGE